MVNHYVDGTNSWEDAPQSPIVYRTAVTAAKDDKLEDHPRDTNFDSVRDFSTPRKGSGLADDEKLESSTSTPKKISKRGSDELALHKLRASRDHERNKSDAKPSKPVKCSISKALIKESPKSKRIDARLYPSSQSCGEFDSKLTDETSHEMFHEVTEDHKDTEHDEETVGSEENDTQQEGAALTEKVQRLENRVEKLEEELREVAALEFSLYSVISDHGSSAYKVHAPARRLSRLYIHACKHWTQSKTATIARNTVSGLILVARTCGNDVPRLMFWLSNTIVLRDIISQTIGISHQPGKSSLIEANSSEKVSEMNVSTMELMKGNSGCKKVIFEDWQETITFTAALLKIESWIFNRVVESVWWQTLTPNMLSPVEDLIQQKNMESLLGPSLGNHKQGAFSLELWNEAFHSAFQKLCPVRAAEHKCGCLPILPRMVMEQCLARLDVAMFNAILRESEHQIPTDPVSDPIVDSRVLPIPAGELSFGSGAQLKNTVGEWSRWLLNTLGMETSKVSKVYGSRTKVDHQQPTVEHTKLKMKCFRFLNELSELLMLPKDMLMDRSVRKEVCPSIHLAVMKRILCNFSPDDFCPDGVPGEVLEALNAESFVEKLVAESTMSFPYTAAVVVYIPPSSEDVSDKVADSLGKPQLETNTSKEPKKGYTSDEELDDLKSPLTSFIEQSSSTALIYGDLNLKFNDRTECGGNSRYELLRHVWSM